MEYLIHYTKDGKKGYFSIVGSEDDVARDVLDELKRRDLNLIKNKVWSEQALPLIGFLNKPYSLSTEGYTFQYRRDRYDPDIIHVELFKDGKVVHKQMSKSFNHKIRMSHPEVINTLEAKISLNQLDPTGLKQTLPQ